MRLPTPLFAPLPMPALFHHLNPFRQQRGAEDEAVAFDDVSDVLRQFGIAKHGTGLATQDVMGISGVEKHSLALALTPLPTASTNSSTKGMVRAES